MAKTLASLFEIEKQEETEEIKKDYAIFQDKKRLDFLRKKIIQNMIDHAGSREKNLKGWIKEEIDKTTEEEDLSLLERDFLFNLIENEMDGYGPITELLKDDHITEIMVNAPDEIYIEIDGHIVKDESVSFIDDAHIIRTIRRMIEPLGRTIDVSNPMVDSRLLDGSRMNAVLPPLSLNGPVLTIRKFRKNLESIDDLLRNGTMTPYMARFLEAAVKAKCNILVCGGTGTGKTTLLNILSSFITEEERIITIEDAAELKLSQPHVVSLETKRANYQIGKEITIRDLVINSLRMRPDRIVIGEVRSKEAFDMLQAMNTGHEGSMTTLHANGPEDALNRLETMVLMAGMEIPVSAVREYIENAIDLVIHIERLSDGRRKVTSICEVDGFTKDRIHLTEIFAFQKKGLTKNKEVDGAFVLYNLVPKTYLKMKQQGISLVEDIFEPILSKKKGLS